MNLFPRSSVDHNSLEQKEKESSLNIDVKFNINIQGEVLMKLIPWLLGGSVVVASGIYGISNNLPPSENEVGNNPLITELVDQSSN